MVVGQIGQRRSLAFFQRDVAVEVFATQPVNEVRQSVGLFVEVGRVDLADVASQDDFRVFTGTRHNRFHLMRCQVLGFVDDEHHVGQRAPSNVGEG